MILRRPIGNFLKKIEARVSYALLIFNIIGVLSFKISIPMKKHISAQINLFGPPLEKEDIEKVLQPNNLDTGISLVKEQLGWFFELPSDALSKEILERYFEATKKAHASIVPHSKEISERLLKPLMAAKKNYCLGEYTATIALGGVVGEMLTILIWKINNIKLNNQPISEKDEERLFGKSFENQIQQRRLQILRTFNLINEEQYSKFNSIRSNRNHHLHRWVIDPQSEKGRALDIFGNALQLFKEITGIGLATAGSLKVNALLLKFLEEQDRQNNT